MAVETNPVYPEFVYTNEQSSTIFSYLCYDATAPDTADEKPSGKLNLKMVAPIKDFPALGGAPEKIETTTLSNDSSTFVTGVQSVDAFEFTANYTAKSFKELKGIQDENKAKRYYIVFGKGKVKSATGESTKTVYGEYGIFYWSGTLSCWLDSGSVNGVRQTKISISSATEVKMVNPEDKDEEGNGVEIESIVDAEGKEV